MADGYTRVTGKPTVSPLLHLGSILGNDIANLNNTRRVPWPHLIEAII